MNAKNREEWLKEMYIIGKETHDLRVFAIKCGSNVRKYKRGTDIYISIYMNLSNFCRKI